MGLFSFLNRKNGSTNHVNGADSAQKISESPQGVFVETNERLNHESGNNHSPSSEHGINLLFQFLEKNYEKKGYDDALMNPDNTHLEQNIAALKNELERTIRKVKTFYEDFIREINFHISSRSRSGMVDTVEELNAKKETAESHIRQVLEIEQEASESKGVAQGIVLSYTRGFRNGLAAISHHSIMNRNF
ncbi:MAG TPA: hypothetical protein VFU62_04020 [Hanamia sp.]|jgi:hypothetical protein|nr:hypothetical protein [Hanamia sp.]